MACALDGYYGHSRWDKTPLGSGVYLGEPVVLLVAYAAVVLAVTRSVNADQRLVMRTEALVGLACAAAKQAP